MCGHLQGNEDIGYMGYISKKVQGCDCVTSMDVG